MAAITTNFNPVTHGFKFINCFEFPDLFKIGLSFSPTKTVGDILYGLCGGMCFASLDFYKAGKQITVESEVEEIPFKLLRYLWERQINTISPPVLEKIFIWSFLEKKAIVKQMTKTEIPAVIKSIDSGEPCVLLVFRSQGLFQITQNHQVLATAYELDPVTHDMTIQIYDPNHPGETPYLTMNLSKPNQDIKLTQSTGEPLLGFFKIDYNAIAPPPSL